MNGAELWGAWRGKGLPETVELCRDLLENPDCPTLRRWKEEGGRILGHFQVYFPEELAHAAGMLPVKVMGSGLEPRLASPRFGSYLCSILKTSLEGALSGKLPLDLFVTHPICDAARNLACVWERAVDYPCQILYLPQNANSAHAAGYLRHEYRRILSEIERIAGREAGPEALRVSIRVFNENRRLLRRLYDAKRRTPWLVSAYEAYLLMAVGTRVAREEHNALLEQSIAQIASRPARPQDKVRLLFSGGFCEQPPLDLLRLVTESCYIVEDDLLVGLRWILEDVPESGDPVGDLARAYLESSDYSPVQHDLRKPKERMLLDRVRSSGASAVVLASAKMCEPGLEDQVGYAKALEEAKVPYFITEFEENMTGFDNLGMQLETFAENLMFD